MKKFHMHCAYSCKIAALSEKCAEMRAKTVLQVKLPGFQCNFVRFNVIPKFTQCDCLNRQKQYCLIICTFSKCSGISKFWPPV